MTSLIKKRKKNPFLNANVFNPKIPKHMYIFCMIKN